MQHLDETKTKFFELRAVSIPYSRIATDLNVAKSTLIEWARKYKSRIDNLRAIELEAAQERFLGSREKQIETLGARLRALEQELDRRKPEFMTYRELNEVIRETRARLDKLCVEPAFVDEVSDAPPSASDSIANVPNNPLNEHPVAAHPTRPDSDRRPVWISAFPREITRPSPGGLVLTRTIHHHPQL